MAYTVQTIIKDVEICMDEIADNDAEFDTNDQDDTERSTIIKSKISEAMRFVYAHADASLLEPDETYSAVTVTSGVPTLTLPDNYLRLVYARYPSWSRYLGQEDIIMWNDKDYSRLKDTYAGASKERPEIAMGWNGKKRTLELYPEVSGEYPTIGIMTEPEVTGDLTPSDELSIPDKCYRAVIYYIAGLTYVTYADQVRSSMMFEQANDIIGFTTTQSQNIQQN